MTDENDDPLPDDVLRLLADADTWTEVDPSVTESAVAAVLAAASPATSGPIAEPPVVASLDDRRRMRWRDAALGAAAVLVLFVGGFAILRAVSSSDDAGTVVALEPTELVPGAAGEARIETTPDGTKILLDVSGLPPAAPGEYYEAWLRTGPDVGVSAGTFHLRGGGDVTIELWAGVTVENYPLFTITRQPEALAASSGEVVLKVRLDG